MSKQETRYVFVTSSTVLAELISQSTDANGVGESKPTIDYETFCLRWKGKTCALRSSKAFSLFERLNRRPGAYVSVGDLIDELWPDYSAERNTVQQTASRLQRKLRDAEMYDLVIDGKKNPGYYGLVIESDDCQ